MSLHSSSEDLDSGSTASMSELSSIGQSKVERKGNQKLFGLIKRPHSTSTTIAGDRTLPAIMIGNTSLGKSISVDTLSVEALSWHYVTINIKEGLGLTGLNVYYVKVKYMDKLLFRSHSSERCSNPVWDQSFDMMVQSLQDQTIQFRLYTQSWLGSSRCLGSSEVKLAELPDGKVKLDLALGRENTTKGLLIIEFVISKGSQEDAKKMLNTLSRTKVDGHCTAVVAVAVVGAMLNSSPCKKSMSTFCKISHLEESYKTKVVKDSLCPFWQEKYDFKVVHDSLSKMEVSVYDVNRSTEPLGSATIDLRDLDVEKGFTRKLELSQDAGIVTLHLTITAWPTAPAREIASSSLFCTARTGNQYNLLNTFSNMKDVGQLQVTVHCARSLPSADINGLSDPYVVLELGNSRSITPTLYKTLSPVWERTYHFEIHDISDVLNITVLDEDKFSAPDFLGRVVLPLQHVQQGERMSFALMDASCNAPTSGRIELTINVVYNSARAALALFGPINTFKPSPYQRLKIEAFQNHITKMKSMIDTMQKYINWFKEILTWRNPVETTKAALVYFLVVCLGELYMIPLIAAFVLLFKLVVDRKVPGDTPNFVEMTSDVESTQEKSEKSSLFDKMETLSRTGLSVQNTLDEILAFPERVRNAFGWTSPFMSLTLLVVLLVTGLLMYAVPVRIWFLLYGVRKFTKGLFQKAVDNNEIIDFFSRSPSDRELFQRFLCVRHGIRLESYKG